MDGLQVLGRHDVFVLHLKLVVGLQIGHTVAPAAYLGAGSAVGARVHLMQAQIALARDSHAESSVAEHLEAHEIAMRAADIVAHDGIAYGGYLLHIELTGQHHHVGPLRVESHRLDIAHIDLSGDMHLHPYRTGIHDGRHIAGDNGRDAAVAHGTDHLAASLELGVIDNGVDREIGLHSGLAAYRGDVAEIVEGEVDRRARPHVEPLDSEIYRISPCLDGGMERLVAPDGSHDLKIFPVH